MDDMIFGALCLGFFVTLCFLWLIKNTLYWFRDRVSNQLSEIQESLKELHNVDKKTKDKPSPG
jgi:hypothetical protein